MGWVGLGGLTLIIRLISVHNWTCTELPTGTELGNHKTKLYKATCSGKWCFDNYPNYYSAIYREKGIIYCKNDMSQNYYVIVFYKGTHITQKLQTFCGWTFDKLASE